MPILKVKILPTGDHLIFWCVRLVATIWRLPGYYHISIKNVWKKCYTTISLWSPTNSDAKISVLVTGFRICNNICTLLFGFGSHRAVYLKKNSFCRTILHLYIYNWFAFQDYIWRFESIAFRNFRFYILNK